MSDGDRLRERGVLALRAAVPIDAALCDELDGAEDTGSVRPGRRLLHTAGRVRAQLAPDGPLAAIAARLLGRAARPVRLLVFDKSADCNWAVPWHQDRTIAVAARRDTPGFGPWSLKAGVHHVEPPFAVLASMLSLRLHLDPCDADNGPLLVAPGSHRLGRVPAPDAASAAEACGVETCEADAGDVLALSTPILHASERARRPRRRRVLHVDFAADELPGGLAWRGV